MGTYVGILLVALIDTIALFVSVSVTSTETLPGCYEKVKHPGRSKDAFKIFVFRLPEEPRLPELPRPEWMRKYDTIDQIVYHVELLLSPSLVLSCVSIAPPCAPCPLHSFASPQPSPL